VDETILHDSVASDLLGNFRTELQSGTCQVIINWSN